jgi:hypothetical protein
MKADHEAAVEKRRLGVDDAAQVRARRRQDRLMQAAAEGRGRLIASWIAAGLDRELAQVLADDESVGAITRLGTQIPPTGLVALEGEFGSGKSVAGERLYLADIAGSLDNLEAPLPIYLPAKSITSSISGAIREQAAAIGEPTKVGVRVILDGLEQVGRGRASEILQEARSIAYSWPNSRIVATTRPGLQWNREEVIRYPALSDTEAQELVQRLGGHHSILWPRSETTAKVLHLPLFLIVGVLRQLAGAEVPRSEGTFIEALANAALERARRPTGEARKALNALARLTTSSGGPLAAAEFGGDDEIELVVGTGIVVRDGRALRFVLPVLEQYFAAQALLSTALDGLDLDLGDLVVLDRWRDTLMLAVTIGSWQQVSAVIEFLTPRLPGLACWLVANAIPEHYTAPTAELPGNTECAARLRRAITGWVAALGQLGTRVGLTDSDGVVRTVGTFVEGGRVMAALELGGRRNSGTAQLPYGFDIFTGAAPDGTQWGPFRWGGAPADFPAWPWRWGLEWMAQGLEAILGRWFLALPANEAYMSERRWTIAKIVTGQARFNHSPMEVEGLRNQAAALLAELMKSGKSHYRLMSRSRLIISTDEIKEFLEYLESGAADVGDGLLRRPYPEPDASPVGPSNHVSSIYSAETLRAITELMYTNTLNIYDDMVSTYFGSLRPNLGLACIMPISLQGKLLVRTDAFDGPDFYKMTPVQLSNANSASIELVARREDLNIDPMLRSLS